MQGQDKRLFILDMDDQITTYLFVHSHGTLLHV